jgi:hypothetical protein
VEYEGGNGAELGFASCILSGELWQVRVAMKAESVSDPSFPDQSLSRIQKSKRAQLHAKIGQQPIEPDWLYKIQTVGGQAASR